MNILIVDDEKAIRFAISELLEFEHNTVIEAETGEQALERLEAHEIDTVILDYQLPGINGLEVLEKIKSTYSHIEVIIITAFGNEEIAIKAIRMGAYDYVAKPFNNEELLNRINHIKRNLLITQQTYAADFGYYFSPAMHEIVNKVKTIANTDIPVLICGESGTGKELIAKLIHHHSHKKGDYIPVNCSALPASLIESELFGAEKGAYTGAHAKKIGLFEQADQGTIFLDEIGEMPVELQAKLLRTLQEGEITRLGSSRPITINARVIAATNINIREDIANKKFREDLYYRLNGIQIELPPLRKRHEDILPLARVFLQEFSQKHHKAIQGLSRDAALLLSNYQWPGNIRQLRNKMEEAVIFCESTHIMPHNFTLQEAVLTTETSQASSVCNTSSSASSAPELIITNIAGLPKKIIEAKKIMTDLFEKQFITHYLEKNNRKVKKTADEIGMYRQDLYKKMRKLNIDLNDTGEDA